MTNQAWRVVQTKEATVDTAQSAAERVACCSERHVYLPEGHYTAFACCTAQQVCEPTLSYISRSQP